MIAISIVSALVLVLFNLKFERPDEGKISHAGKTTGNEKCGLGALVRSAQSSHQSFVRGAWRIRADALKEENHENSENKTHKIAEVDARAPACWRRALGRHSSAGLQRMRRSSSGGAAAGASMPASDAQATNKVFLKSSRGVRS